MTAQALAVAAALWAQGLLIFAVTAVMYQRRVPRILRKEISIADVAIDKDGWPVDARLAANSYANQFEMPVLFFVAGAGTLWLGAGWLEAVLCWAFVASRAIHVGIHLTTNRVTRRFFAFAIGVLLVAALWLVLGVKLLLVGFA